DSGDMMQVEQLLGWQDFPGLTTVGRVFHHALLVKPGADAWRVRMSALLEDMVAAQAALRRAAGSLREHRDHVAALSHAIRQFRYLAERELALDDVGRTLGDKSLGELGAPTRDSVYQQFDHLYEAARALAYDYPRLWLVHNRAPSSPLVEEHLADQVAML